MDHRPAAAAGGRGEAGDATRLDRTFVVRDQPWRSQPRKFRPACLHAASTL
jgi:hypothetical protein